MTPAQACQDDPLPDPADQPQQDQFPAADFPESSDPSAGPRPGPPLRDRTEILAKVYSTRPGLRMLPSPGPSHLVHGRKQSDPRGPEKSGAAVTTETEGIRSQSLSQEPLHRKLSW